jgi:hypothetical protein
VFGTAIGLKKWSASISTAPRCASVTRSAT